MNFLYDFIIQIYTRLQEAAAYFHPKAKLRTRGLKNQKPAVKKLTEKNTNCIWMHCASLGEFEQGRPLLEKIRKQQPNTCIVLTFYSPSGYEKQKNFYAADYVFYLPNDTKKQAKQFIESIRPNIAIFKKIRILVQASASSKQISCRNISDSRYFPKKSNIFQSLRPVFPKHSEIF